VQYNARCAQRDDNSYVSDLNILFPSSSSEILAVL